MLTLAARNRTEARATTPGAFTRLVERDLDRAELRAALDAVLDIPRGTVASRKPHAAQHLRRELERTGHAL